MAGFNTSTRNSLTSNGRLVTGKDSAGAGHPPIEKDDEPHKRDLFGEALKESKLVQAEALPGHEAEDHAEGGQHGDEVDGSDATGTRRKIAGEKDLVGSARRD